MRNISLKNREDQRLREAANLEEAMMQKLQNTMNTQREVLSMLETTMGMSNKLSKK